MVGVQHIDLLFIYFVNDYLFLSVFYGQKNEIKSPIPILALSRHFLYSAIVRL